MKAIFTFSISFLIHFQVFGGISCPSDITISCSDDYHNTEMTGEPTLLGNHSWYIPRYIDTKYLNVCNIGYIERMWFGDQNSNYIVDNGEPYCTQIITLNGDIDNVNIIFPQDVVLSCISDIPDEGPYWTSAPCDIVGYTYDEETITFAQDACYKILRHYQVINWCIYDPNTNNNEGIWYHTQVIKVIDNLQPEIALCNDLTFPVKENCETSVTLTNSAEDLGDCPSPNLSWTINIDLWADGTNDYTYGAFESGDFYIAPSTNGQEIEFTLPELVEVGSHKIVWKVRDACGNVKSCSSKFYTVDQKPPTPYCHLILTTTVNGSDDTLRIKASDFNLGAFDNCTNAEDLKFTFSPLEGDDIREITCTNDGFRFFRIYVTDLQGNSDFCEVFLIAFDNGSCNNKIAFEGRIINQNGLPFNDAVINVMNEGEVAFEAISQDNGTYSFDELPLMQSYSFSAEFQDEIQIDLADLVLLQRYYVGLEQFDNTQKVAADVTGDNKIRVNDIQQIADFLLGKTNEFEGGNQPKFIPLNFINDINPNNMYRQSINFGEIPGNLDFKAIYPGNVQIEEENNGLKGQIDLEWIENEDGSSSLITKQGFESEGIYFSLNYDLETSVENINPKLSINYDDQFNKTFRALKANNSTFKKGEVIISIPSSKINEITLEAYTLNQKLEKVVWKINNSFVNNETRIYPSVGNGIFEVSTASVINVFDINGISQNFTFNNNTLNIENLNSGIYFIQVKDKNNFISLKKIIKL